MTSSMDDHRKTAIDHFVTLLAGIDAQVPFGRFLQDHGVYHPAARLPEGLRQLQPKRCFANAQNAVVSAVKRGRDPFVYCEGYACSGTLSVSVPIHHAWLLDEDGTVVDQTWSSPEKATYFGVAFTSQYVMDRFSLYGRKFNSLIDDRRDLWRLLKDADVAEEAVFRASVSPTAPLPGRRGP